MALQDEEDLAVIPIIITDVLQGFRTDSGFLGSPVALPVIEPTVDCHVRAARLFRSLRQKGFTAAFAR